MRDRTTNGASHVLYGTVEFEFVGTLCLARAAIDVDFVHIGLLGVCPVKKRAKSVPAVQMATKRNKFSITTSNVANKNRPKLHVNFDLNSSKESAPVNSAFRKELSNGPT